MSQVQQEKLPKERESLVTDNLNLVHFVLKKTFHMSPYQTEYDDYYQEGCIGLILSAMRFDESKGFKFSTYAYRMICGCIQRYKRDRQNFVRLPRDKYTLIMKVIQLSAQGFTMSEIEEVTGYSGKDIQRALSMSNLDSLDRTIIDDSNHDITLSDTASNSTDEYAEMLSEEHIFECIPKVTEMLSYDLYKNIWEEWIWALYYGEKLNQTYFSMKYGISQAQVSRILRNCKKLFVKVLTT